MAFEISELERARLTYRPRVPDALTGDPSAAGFRELAPTTAAGDAEAIRERFPRTFGRPVLELGGDGGGGPARTGPLRVGVVLSGGQAPGGHNVIGGLLEGLLAADGGSTLLGFLGGPAGILDRRHRELTPEVVDPFRNTGGFDMIGSGRDKIESDAQLAAARAAAVELQLDGLVIAGGDDSNTNAAVLAESFVEHGVPATVVGVPKTIDGDLRGDELEMSFGFDTASRVYSELIGNIARDARSAGKYWHFIRLMGRSTSHVTLECALQTRPDVALIGEEVDERRDTLEQIAARVADVVARRVVAGRRYGVCLVPEGLIEFIPEIRSLIDELNGVLSEHARKFEALGSFDEQEAFAAGRLSEANRRVLRSLPPGIRSQLLLDRDAHGNVRVSQIDTERLLLEAVRQQLRQRSPGDGLDPGSFRALTHFFGYEGRCAAPSNFDADYAWALGRVAAALVAFRRTGYVCALRGLAGPSESWLARAVPLTALMHVERRQGRETPVIAKAPVRTGGPVFRAFAAQRDRDPAEDVYRYPGPIQYFGPDEVARGRCRTLELEWGGAPAR